MSLNHLSFRSQQAFCRAEAVSLQEPELLDCDVCQYDGTDRQFECWKCEQEAIDEAMEATYDSK